MPSETIATMHDRMRVTEPQANVRGGCRFLVLCGRRNQGNNERKNGMGSKKPQYPDLPPDQDPAKYTDAQHVSNLVLLVGRLVRQVLKVDNENTVAEQAMDYLRRSDLKTSILRGVTENIKRPTSPPPPRKRV